MSVRGRRRIFDRYESEEAALNTPFKRVAALAVVAGLLVLPLWLTADHTGVLTRFFVFALGAIGMNIITGYAGQLSLGHAFFVGIGAYTATVMAAPTGGALWGMDLDMALWLPAAGMAAAAIGLAVAPAALRVKGLYLAVVTLGLVFLGEHVFKEATPISGGVGVGRSAPTPEFLGVDLTTTSELAGVVLTGHHKFYLACLGVLLLGLAVAHTLLGSKIGRAFMALRDQDIAAEAMGISLTRYKFLAFMVSSFFAGVAGALLIVETGFVEPTYFNLLLSVNFLAMILIGGAGSLPGSLMGAAFVVIVPRLVDVAAQYLPLVSDQSGGSGLLSVFELQTLLFGVLIVVFLVTEPRGLHGLWIRVRNYWQQWPFSY